MGGFNNLLQSTLRRVVQTPSVGGSSHVAAAAPSSSAGGDAAGRSVSFQQNDDANKKDETNSATIKQQEESYQSILHSLYVQHNDENVLKGMPDGYVPPPPPPQVVAGQYWTIAPSDADVLCGRGSKINTHPGNIAFRDMVTEWKDLYLSPYRRKSEKAHVCSYLVDKIRATTGGRFLKRDDLRRIWVEIGDVKARKKALQTLREDATEIRAAKAAAAVAAAAVSATPRSIALLPASPVVIRSKPSKGRAGLSPGAKSASSTEGDFTMPEFKRSSFPETLYCIERIHLPEGIRLPMSPIEVEEKEKEENRVNVKAKAEENEERSSREGYTTTLEQPTDQGLHPLGGDEKDKESGESSGGEDFQSIAESALLQESVQSFPVSSCAGTSANMNSFHVTGSCTGFSSSDVSSAPQPRPYHNKTSLISVGGDVVKIDGVPLLGSFSPVLPRSPVANADPVEGNASSSASKKSKRSDLGDSSVTHTAEARKLLSLPMAAFHPLPSLPDAPTTRPLFSRPTLPQAVVPTFSKKNVSSPREEQWLRQSSRTSELTSSLRSAASSILRGSGPAEKKIKSPPLFTYQYFHHGDGGRGTVGVGHKNNADTTSLVGKPSSPAQEGHAPYPATGLLRLRNLFPRRPSLGEDSSTCTNISDSILRESMESFDASNVDDLLEIGHWLDQDEAPAVHEGTRKKKVVDLTGETAMHSASTESDIFEREEEEEENDTAHEVLLAAEAFEHARRRRKRQATLDGLVLNQDIIVDLDDFLSNTSQLLSSLTISVECVVVDSPPPSILNVDATSTLGTINRRTGGIL